MSHSYFQWCIHALFRECLVSLDQDVSQLTAGAAAVEGAAARTPELLRVPRLCTRENGNITR